MTNDTANTTASSESSSHASEIAAGERFEFGENWRRFLASVSEERITTAIASVQDLLGISTLKGKTFVDVGCGSGLFSLAAHRMGAQVHSFDFDPASVACCQQLKETYGKNGATWKIEQGSALDPAYLKKLGQFDVVYSWGVLHHTGEMWQAIDNVCKLTKPSSLFTIAIYNDQGSWSDRWKRIKKTYNNLPRFIRPIFAAVVTFPFDLRMALSAFLRFKPMEYIRVWTSYENDRGMNRWHDIIDWVGGYPFEVAKPEEMLKFFRDRDFVLTNLKTRLGSLGCNEFVFQKQAEAPAEIKLKEQTATN